MKNNAPENNKSYKKAMRELDRLSKKGAFADFIRKKRKQLKEYLLMTCDIEDHEADSSYLDEMEYLELDRLEITKLLGDLKTNNDLILSAIINQCLCEAKMDAPTLSDNEKLQQCKQLAKRQLATKSSSNAEKRAAYLMLSISDLGKELHPLAAFYKHKKNLDQDAALHPPSKLSSLHRETSNQIREFIDSLTCGSSDKNSINRKLLDKLNGAYYCLFRAIDKITILEQTRIASQAYSEMRDIYEQRPKGWRSKLKTASSSFIQEIGKIEYAFAKYEEGIHYFSDSAHEKDEIINAITANTKYTCSHVTAEANREIAAKAPKRKKKFGHEGNGMKGPKTKMMAYQQKTLNKFLEKNPVTKKYSRQARAKQCWNLHKPEWDKARYATGDNKGYASYKSLSAAK